MLKVDQLRAKREALINQQSKITSEIAEIDRELQGLCIHDWKWHQIAGEGRYCAKCGKRDFDCDD